VKLLFFMRSTVYVRNFESTLRMLADRGHDVVVVADPHRTHLIDRIRRESRRLRYVPGLRVPFNRWSFLGAEIRRALDYLRYLEPEYASATKLRQRAQRKAPEAADGAAAVAARAITDRASAVAQGIAAVRSSDTARSGRRRLHPPARPRSRPRHAARRARLAAVGHRAQRTRLEGTGGLVRVQLGQPDEQGVDSRHARSDYGMGSRDGRRSDNAARCAADGCPHHGRGGVRPLVSWRPRDSRDSFCARVGLAIHAPYLLYLCSSKFISHDELPFIRRWVTGIRDASRALRDVSVLVQPTKAMHRS